MKALVTGASSGIGRDIAKILCEKGYDIIAVARDTEKLESLKEELSSKFPREIKTISMDLAVADNCKKLYEAEPDIDLLINNAGFGICGEFTKTNLDKEIALINTNIQAIHILTKLYLQNMKSKDKGQILNVASIAGFMPGPLMAAYYASKAYVVRLSEAIREELKKSKSHVKISILCPGPVKTNFNKVANVEFAVKSLSSEYVAKYTIKQMEKGKFYIIPGFTIKLAKIGSKIAPTSLVSKISYKMQKRKIQ